MVGRRTTINSWLIDMRKQYVVKVIFLNKIFISDERTLQCLFLSYWLQWMRRNKSIFNAHYHDSFSSYKKKKETLDILFLCVHFLLRYYRLFNLSFSLPMYRNKNETKIAPDTMGYQNDLLKFHIERYD